MEGKEIVKMFLQERSFDDPTVKVESLSPERQTKEILFRWEQVSQSILWQKLFGYTEPLAEVKTLSDLQSFLENDEERVRQFSLYMDVRQRFYDMGEWITNDWSTHWNEQYSQGEQIPLANFFGDLSKRAHFVISVSTENIPQPEDEQMSSLPKLFQDLELTEEQKNKLHEELLEDITAILIPHLESALERTGPPPTGELVPSSFIRDNFPRTEFTGGVEEFSRQMRNCVGYDATIRLVTELVGQFRFYDKDTDGTIDVLEKK